MRDAVITLGPLRPKHKHGPVILILVITTVVVPLLGVQVGNMVEHGKALTTMALEAAIQEAAIILPFISQGIVI